jgi:molybdopterin-synthase adenylyltransferase
LVPGACIVAPLGVVTTGAVTKVNSCWSSIRQLDRAIEVEALNDRYRQRLSTGEAVFCCVDSISAREAI